MMLALTHRPDSLPQFKHPHEFPTAFPPSSSRAHDPPSRRSSTPQQMATQHRGLPPPAAMTLPDPTRVQHQSLPPNIGPMPGPPPQWHGSEDSMRDWLSAKSEEDKRRQEEEKTRQEELRLEQRRVERRAPAHGARHIRWNRRTPSGQCQHGHGPAISGADAAATAAPATATTGANDPPIAAVPGTPAGATHVDATASVSISKYTTSTWISSCPRASLTFTASAC